MEELYQEAVEAGTPHRVRYLEQVQYVLEQRQAQARARRAAFFQPDMSSAQAYEVSLGPLRERFSAMLGYPLVETPAGPAVPAARLEPVAKDSLGSIFRVHVEAMAGYEMYGVLFLPHGEGPHRLVVGQHGGQGTPELMSEFFRESNYNNLTRRVLRRGYAVFCPQLLLWNPEFGPEFDRPHIDRALKQVGGSIAALQLFGLQRCLDYLLARPDIRPDGAGMVGLSYGGFYTLFLAALDTRIKAAVSSCFVNDRLTYNWVDWVWQESAHLFLDAEVAGLVCPRPLFVEVGTQDGLFEVAKAEPVLAEIAERYRALGLQGHYQSSVFEGGHEFAKTDISLDFLERHFPATA